MFYDSFKFAYLFGSLYFLAIWFLIFFLRPQYRKFMIIFGFLFAPIGVFATYFLWISDWWHPETITGTPVGIEDFIMAFTHVSIPALVYKFIFRKGVDLKLSLNDKALLLFGLKKFIILCLIGVLSTVLSFYFFKINSFFATAIGMFLVGLYIILKRKDLLSASLWSAALMFAVSLPVYVLGNFLYPNVIQNFWDFSHISGILFLGVPIEDLIWYALLGFFMGGIYEFLFDFKLENS